MLSITRCLDTLTNRIHPSPQPLVSAVVRRHRLLTLGLRAQAEIDAGILSSKLKAIDKDSLASIWADTVDDAPGVTHQPRIMQADAREAAASIEEVRSQTPASLREVLSKLPDMLKQQLICDCLKLSLHNAGVALRRHPFSRLLRSSSRQLKLLRECLLNL